MRFFSYRTLCMIAALFAASCSKNEVTFHVTRSSELPVRNIEVVAVGKIADELGRTISLPRQMAEKSKKGRGIDTFVSNRENADLVRSLLISEISKGGEYRIVNASGGEESYSGVIPDMATVGVIHARVRYYEYTKEDKDKRFFVLLITNNGAIKKKGIQEQVGIAVLKRGVAGSAERSGKGFEIAIPYVEKVAALEVEFDFVRKSNGRNIVPTQTFREYFTKKWDGDGSRSVLAKELRKVILEHYALEEDNLTQLVDRLAASAMILRGGERHADDRFFSKRQSRIPLLSLDLKQRLAQKVARAYANKISRHHERTTLSVASGNTVGVTLIRGNAYDKAIGYLESLRKPLDAHDTYNLALAYESMGEYAQAQKYYEEGFRKTGEERFRQGVKRVER